MRVLVLSNPACPERALSWIGERVSSEFQFTVFTPYSFSISDELIIPTISKGETVIYSPEYLRKFWSQHKVEEPYDVVLNFVPENTMQFLTNTCNNYRAMSFNVDPLVLNVVEESFPYTVANVLSTTFGFVLFTGTQESFLRFLRQNFKAQVIRRVLDNSSTIDPSESWAGFVKDRFVRFVQSEHLDNPGLAKEVLAAAYGLGAFTEPELYVKLTELSTSGRQWGRKGDPISRMWIRRTLERLGMFPEMGVFRANPVR